MNRLWIVASYEFFTNIKKPSFLFGLFGVPVFTIVIFIIVALVTATAINSGEVTGDAIGYVDTTSILSQTKDLPQGWQAFADEASAKSALTDKTIEAYFVTDANFMASGNLSFYANGTAPESVKDAIKEFVTVNLVAQTNSNLPAKLLEKPVSLNIIMANTGREINEDAFLVLFLIPMIFMIVFMISLQISSSFLMSGVVEEKSNRVMELLITTVSPYQLLGGKVIGLGAIGLVQLAVWFGFGAIGFLLSRNVESLQGIFVPWDLVVIAIIYFFMSYFMFASILAGVGVLVDSEQESRQFAVVISLTLAIPLILIGPFLEAPNGALPTFLSLFPFTSGMSMLFRYAFGNVPFWQLLLSLAILLATTVFVVWASAKVFKWALLMVGKRATPMEIWRVIRGNAEIGGVA